MYTNRNMLSHKMKQLVIDGEKRSVTQDREIPLKRNGLKNSNLTCLFSVMERHFDALPFTLVVVEDKKAQMQNQTLTLLLMPRRACWKEPGTFFPWDVLTTPDQYRYRYSQPTTRLSPGTKRIWKGIAITQSSQRLNQQPKSTHGGSHGLHP